MPALLEIVVGSMSILRIGPVTVPLHGMVRIAMKSEMLLVLRHPRLEIQAAPPGVNMKCEIEDIWVGEERPNFPQDRDRLGVIRPGEKLQAILVNHMSQNANASVVVEGDAARVVHWAADCSLGMCPSCRWRTTCRHEKCERSADAARRCAESRESAYLQTLSSNASSNDSSGAGTSRGVMWRPWNPLSK